MLRWACCFVLLASAFGCGSEGAGGARGAGGGAAGAVAGGAAGSTAAGAAGAGAAQAAGGGVMGGPAGAAGSAGSGMVQPLPGKPYVYVGGSGDAPLRVYALDRQSGALTEVGDGFDAGTAPTYLAVAPTGKYLYAANEESGPSAGVTALQIAADGSLTRLNHQASSDDCDGGCGATHLAVAPNGKALVSASYNGGSISLFPIMADGSLGAEAQLLDFGAGALAHGVAFDSMGRHVYVPTLGLDRVQQLSLGQDGKLSPSSPAFASSPAGAGPRHIALHPGGKLAFVVNENASSVTSFQLASNGTLTPGASVGSLPAGFDGESYGQHIEVSPNGRFVYSSNVGHDSIAVFAVDQQSGALSQLEVVPSGAAWPRDFDIDPNGDLLVVANRDSSRLTLFRIAEDGTLGSLGEPVQLPLEPSTVLIHYLAP